MTEASRYMKYLVGEQICKRMESIGAAPGSVYLLSDAVHVGLALTFGTDRHRGYYATDEQREQLAADFLAAFPDSTIDRTPGYSGGKPDMKVRGETSLGIKWQVDFGYGVCEQVQVGTKTVTKYDEEALAGVPMIEVEEPVYEYRCPDPLNDLMKGGA